MMQATQAIELPMDIIGVLQKRAECQGMSLQGYILQILEDYEDSLEVDAFMANHPNGWERADATEVAQIEALLAQSL